MASALGLQISLYLNIFILPVWLLSEISLMFLKYEYIEEEYRLLAFILLTGGMTVECVRLYLGYRGNLLEKIPDMAAFWLLTLQLQVPFNLYHLFNTIAKMQVIELAIQSYMFLLIIIQVVTGFFALKDSIRHTTEVKN